MKRILSIVLVLTLSCFAIAGVSAAEEFTPSDDPVIYFEVPEDWTDNGFKKVYCHIWAHDEPTAPLAAWQSKKEICTETETPGVYSYDISKVGALEEGKMYCVIFSADTGSQTYDTFFDTNCFGDTLYCAESPMEAPQDSTKTCLGAFWKHQDSSVYGPVMRITSIGNVIGTALPPGETEKSLISAFIDNGLHTAIIFSGITKDEIFAKLAEQFGLTKEEMDAIRNPHSSDNEAPGDEVLLGDADMNGKVNVKDATAVQKQVAGMAIEIDMDAADADQNGKVNVKDATSIQKWVAGMPVATPIGQFITLA